MKTEKEINQVIDECSEIEEGVRECGLPSLYVEAIKETLMWVMGDGVYPLSD